MKLEIAYKFLQRFKRFSVEKQLIEPGEKVVVAVSGGLDSMVLFWCLKELARKMRLSLIVAHFNHALRGRAADEDEEFVRTVAEEWQIPFRSGKKDVGKVAAEEGQSIEMAARAARYAFLHSLLKKESAHKIATAHHADDQVETVLMNLARGAGWPGLSGIPVKRGEIIRPLLFAYRSELEAVAQEAGISFRQDHTNFSPVFQRNRIRHQILPLLRRELNPGIDRHLIHLSIVADETEAFLRSEAEKRLASDLQEEGGKFLLEIDRFSGYFSILRKYVLFHLLAHAGIPKNALSFQQVETIVRSVEARKSGRFFHIWEDWYFHIEQKWLVLSRRKDPPEISLTFTPGKTVWIPEIGWEIRSQVISPREFSPGSDSTIEFMDADRIANHTLSIRSVRPGDWFYPLGLGKRRKLSDFFIDHKVPLSERKKALVLTCGDDIAWLIGYRLDHRFRVTPNTSTVLKLEVNKGWKGDLS